MNAAIYNKLDLSSLWPKFAYSSRRSNLINTAASPSVSLIFSIKPTQSRFIVFVFFFSCPQVQLVMQDNTLWRNTRVATSVIIRHAEYLKYRLCGRIEATAHLQNGQLARDAVTPLDQEETRAPLGGSRRINKSSVEFAGGLSPCRTRSGNLYFYVVPVAVTRAHIHGGACATTVASSPLLSSSISTLVCFSPFFFPPPYHDLRDILFIQIFSLLSNGSRWQAEESHLNESIRATLAPMNDEWCKWHDRMMRRFNTWWKNNVGGNKEARKGKNYAQ